MTMSSMSKWWPDVYRITNNGKSRTSESSISPEITISSVPLLHASMYGIPLLYALKEQKRKANQIGNEKIIRDSEKNKN